jgi:putative protease
MKKSGRIDVSAGDFTALQAALDNGADSVYFGVEQLNMRARASMNFTLMICQKSLDVVRKKEYELILL